MPLPCCVSGCLRHVRCDVCMRCEEHCICLEPSPLDCGRGLQGFLEATFASAFGTIPRARKSGLNRTARWTTADNEQMVLREVSRLQQASDMDVKHYTFIRSDGSRSVLSDGEEQMLRSLSSVISRNKVKLVTKPGNKDSEGSSHGLELLLNTGLLFSTRFVVPSYIRNDFDTMPLAELDNIVLAPDCARSYRNSGEWIVILPKINRDIRELEDYKFSRPSRVQRHKGIFDPPDKDVIGGWIQTVMQDSKGETLQCDIGVEDAVRRDVKVMCFAETTGNGRHALVGEHFGPVLVTDVSESVTVERRLNMSSPESAKRRIWHVNGYEERIIMRNLRKASAVLGKAKLTDLHTISRLARVSFEDAAWGLERDLIGIPLNYNSGCYLATMKRRTETGLNLAPVVLRAVLGVSVFDRDARLVDREGKLLEIRDGHISHCKEPREQPDRECYDLEEVVNGASQRDSHCGAANPSTPNECVLIDVGETDGHWTVIGGM